MSILTTRRRKAASRWRERAAIAAAFLVAVVIGYLVGQL
jgi:hypothetical protein